MSLVAKVSEVVEPEILRPLPATLQLQENETIAYHIYKFSDITRQNDTDYRSNYYSIFFNLLYTLTIPQLKMYYQRCKEKMPAYIGMRRPYQISCVHFTAPSVLISHVKNKPLIAYA
jgi:hypothetical protein